MSGGDKSGVYEQNGKYDSGGSRPASGGSNPSLFVGKYCKYGQILACYPLFKYSVFAPCGFVYL